MTAPLHLLRGFVQWYDRRGGRGEIKTVDEAEAWVRHIADLGFERFYTWTSRRPQRGVELEGGSAYFVRSGRTLFRMPFLAIEHEGEGVNIVMRPELIRVEKKRVGMARGWRYLADADAPPDLAPAPDAELPPHLQSELKELGLA